mmetsp:Transcript_11368/g.32536  ORF Transcript_11368/g.32536 Transcript_11368/m.32536 type:complete len:203 (+) Transcript_11368:535-1143(+)
MLGMANKAFADALKNTDCKPNFEPWVFSKRSLYSLRKSMNLVMSTSLNVVSAACMFWADFKFRAMVERIRVNFTRFSPRSVEPGAFDAGAAVDDTDAAGEGGPGEAGGFGGASGADALPGAAGAAPAAACAAGAGSLAGAVAPAAGDVRGAAATLMRQSGAPTWTVSSGFAKISTISPESGALTSIVTLSVSMAAMNSPLLT